jgi:uncharacterized protein (DUF2252 family)
VARESSKSGLLIQDRLDQGKALRQVARRAAHAAWNPPRDRRDPVDILLASDGGRVESLVPIRHGRMAESAFAFYRGAAAIMAADLATTPGTGFRVQCCGDCHLMNFGGFATPERRFVFDINDFDETLPAPWEWDVKRLAASFVVAGRSLGLKRSACGEAARAAVCSYRERIWAFARMPSVQVWYERIDANKIFDVEDKTSAARGASGRIRLRPGGLHLTDRITTVVKGARRFIDRPPLLFHENDPDGFTSRIEDYFDQYRHSVQMDRRFLLSRYRVIDSAVKIVGVGSVGTRCAITLLEAAPGDLLVLQFKEARASVLEPFAGASVFQNHAERVVQGQRLMQSASDMFLGWCHAERGGYDFYFRQLRDMKTSVSLEGADATWLKDYGTICGWALARAHARGGDPAVISGYLDTSDNFDLALVEFAHAYADQTERDFDGFRKAVKSGRVPVAAVK